MSDLELSKRLSADFIERYDPTPVVTQMDQLKFLLESAPMIDFQPDFIQRAFTKFAYIHPKTLAKVATHEATPNGPYIVFPGAKMKTKWLLTSLMPEGRVIFSPNPMPGYEKRVA